MQHRFGLPVVSCFAAAALAVTACGGGGGPTSKTAKTTSPDSQGNTTLATAAALTTAGDSLVAVASAEGILSGNPLASDGVVDAFNVNAVTSYAFQALAVTTTKFFCSSPDPANVDTGNGSITIVVDDKDPPGRSTGDTVTTTYDKCTQAGRTLTGTKQNAVNAATGTPFAIPPWSLDTSMTVDLTTVSASRQTVEKSSSTVQISSTDGVVTNQKVAGTSQRSVSDASGSVTSNEQYAVATVTDMNAQMTSKDIDVKMSRSDGSSRSIKTITTLVGSLGGAPDSGVLEIKEINAQPATNRVTRLTAQASGMVLVEVDDNGDGVVDRSFTTSWFAVISIGIGACPAVNCSIPSSSAPIFTGPLVPPPSSGSRPVAPVPPVTTPPPSGFVPPPGGFTPPPGGFVPPPTNFTPPPVGVVPPTTTIGSANTTTETTTIN